MRIHQKIVFLIAVASLLAACGGPTEFSSAPGHPAAWEEQRRLVGIWTNQELRKSASAADPSNVTHSTSSMQASILPAADGRLSVLFGAAAHPQASSQTVDSRAVAFWIEGTGHVVRLGSERLLVFRRSPGRFDDYTAPNMRPGYHLFRLVFSGDDELNIYNIREKYFHNLSEDGSVWIGNVRGKNRTGNVDYKIVAVPARQLTTILENTSPDKLFNPRPVRFYRARNYFDGGVPK